MLKNALAATILVALLLPAYAQKKDEAKKDAKAVAIPTNMFFKGQTVSQYLAKERLLGAKVLNKDGASVGTIDDLILNQAGQIEGVIMVVGGFLGVGQKQVGVQMRALRIATGEGKVTVTLPGVTSEMLSAVPAYQRASAPPAKK